MRMLRSLFGPSSFHSSVGSAPTPISSRRFSLSCRRNFIFKNLFNHLQFAQRAKKAAQARGIDLSNLTAEQELKLAPVLRLRSAFRVVNVVMGVMGVVGGSVWYTRRKREKKLGEEINEQLKPIWMNLKYFKQKGAMIDGYLLPEPIVTKLKSIKEFSFEKTDCICASFPKSGTTFIQELVYLIETQFDYASAKQLDITDRYAFLEWPTVRLERLSKVPPGTTRFFKTHLPPKFFDPSFSKAKVSFSASLGAEENNERTSHSRSFTSIAIRRMSRCPTFISFARSMSN